MVTSSRLVAPTPRIGRRLSSRSSSSLRALRTKSRPTAVSITALVVRSNRRTPSARSSFSIRREAPGGSRCCPSSAQESTYDVVKKRATLIAGVKNDYPPFGFVDGDGKWVGIEVDMSKYIADKLGVALKMEPVTSRTRIPLLVNGNIDLIMNIN